ncbi:hypothetical protein NTH60_000906 [Enterobacter ludwigii]|nr:hypothetical protein [Enterobacter ludwigii]
MFYITILICALIGAITHGPVGVLAGAVIGFLIAKIDHLISKIGQTGDPDTNGIFVKRICIAVGVLLAYGIFEAIRR